VAVVAIGIFVYFNMFSQQAEAWLFRLLDSFANSEYKIPVNSSQIRFSFDSKVNKDSLTDSNIYFQPKLEGNWKVDDNFLVFEPSDKLAKNSEYEIFLSKNIKNNNWQNLDKDYQFTVSVVDSARVVSANPSSGTLLQALHQNIAVFFSMPMVSLSSIDAKENLPCPIKIVPEVKGRCIWTTTSVVEFEPSEWFEWSTKYEVIVSNIDGMNNKLEEDYKFTFSTPTLRAYISDFYPENGLQITFNFPVITDELRNKMKIVRGHDSLSWFNYDIFNNDATNTSFTIHPKNGKFQYSSSYNIEFQETKPQNGNINMSWFDKQISSKDFVTQPSPQKDLKSETWTVLQTINYEYEAWIPSENFYFIINFATWVILDNNNIKLVDWNWKVFQTKLEYIKEEIQDENNPLIKKIVENKAKVRMSIAVGLKKNSKYEIIVSKNLNPYIHTDYKFEYKTAPELEILDWKNIDYAMSCVYLSNKLPEYYGLDFADSPISKVSTTPESPIRGFNYIYPNPQYPIECEKSIPKSLDNKNYHIYQIDHRMNPNMKYKLNIDKNLSDIYGNKLLKDGSFDIQTREIADKDKYLYFGGKELNVIPSSAPLVFNAQTINLDEINIEACEMDIEWYLKFLPRYNWTYNWWSINSNWYQQWYWNSQVYYQNSYTKFDPSELCVNFGKKNLKVKNMNWNLSENKFDIGEIMWARGHDPLSESNNDPLSENESYDNPLSENESNNDPLSEKKKPEYSEFYEGENSGDLDIREGDLESQAELSPNPPKNLPISQKIYQSPKFTYIIGTKNWNFDYRNNYRGNPYQFDSLYIKTDFNIVVEKAGDKSLIFVTDLSWNSIIWLDFQVYDSKYEWGVQSYFIKKIKIWEKWNGIYEILGKDESGLNYGDVIFATKWDKFGMLNMSNDSTDNYDFGYIAGSSTSQKDYLYLYTERPIYKPWDTVYMKWILRTFKPTGYDKSLVKKWKIKVLGWNSYDAIAERNVTLDKNSNFDTKRQIPSDIWLGEYRFVFVHKSNGDYEEEIYNSTANIRVEEYTKPVFKINAEVDKKQVSLGDEINFQISAEYYFWGKMSNTEWYYNILSQSYFFDSKDYSEFQFGEWYAYYDCIYRWNCKYDDNLEIARDNKFKIWERWNYNMKNKFSDKIEDWERIYNFSFVIQDPDTRKTVKKTESVIVHSTDGYVGIYAPYRVDRKDPARIELAILDRNANPKVWSTAKLEIYKTEWKKVSKQWVDGTYYRDYYLDEKLIETKTLTADEKWIGIYNFSAKEDGNYKLVATYKWANNKEFKSSRDIFVSGDSYYSWRNDNNSITEVIADKVRWVVGEKMWFTVQSPVNQGQMLVLILKDDGILDYKIEKITSFAPRFEVQIKDNYYPNFYTKVYLIWTQDKNPLPVWKRWLAVTKVDTEYKKLKIWVSTDKQNYQPRQKINLTISVKDSKGNPVKNANLSVGIVDQSLLALMWNPKKNPFAYFYDLKRYLGTTTYTSLKWLVERLEVKNANDGSKWWDGENTKWWDSKKKRWIFKDTARWLANWTTDSNGILKLTTDELPDNLTTREIEVLATSPDMKIWIWQTTITTTKNVIINDNLPIWFGSDDEIILNPVIFSKIWKNSKFEISITWTNIEFEQNKFETEIWNNESKTILIKSKIKNIWLLSWNNTQSRIEISAKALATNDEDVIYKYLPINPTSIPETVSTFGKTTGLSFQEIVDLDWILPNPWTLTINYWPTIFGSVLDGVDFVGYYPYWGLEQKLSAFMPHIYNKNLFESAGEGYDLKKKFVKKWIDNEQWFVEVSIDQSIKDFISTLSNFQNTDGWYVLRDLKKSTRNQKSDPRLTSYVLSSLARLQKLGYAIPKEQTKSAISFLSKNYYANVNCCRDSGAWECQFQSTRVSVINSILDRDDSSNEASKMYSKLNQTCENNRYNKLGIVEIMAKLSKSKNTSSEMKKDLENKISEIWKNIIANELVFSPRGAYLGKTEYESKIITTAKFIEIIGIMGNNKFTDYDMITTNIIRRLMIQKKNWHRWSTQENIAVIRAVSSFLSDTKELTNLDMTTTLNINNNLIWENKFDSKNKFETISQIIPLNQLQAKNTFTAKKEWDWNLYYDLQMKYYLPTENIKARDMGFAVETKYYDYNEYKSVQILKNEERKKYEKWEISYKNMKYNKPIISYLSEISGFTVWQVVVVHNKIITNESRDQVAFDGYFPAGAMLINPNLATEEVKPLESNNQEMSYNNYQQWLDYDTEHYRTEKTQNMDFFWNTKLFDYTEYRYDKFFGYVDKINPGIYEFSYMIRITHPGNYNVKPSQIFEFYQPEVFGYNGGRKVIVK